MPVAFEIPVFKVGIVFISSTFYGFFVILFVLSAFILHHQNNKPGVEHCSSTRTYLTLCYLTFLVLTTVWVLSAVMCFNPTVVDAPDVVENYTPLMFSQHIVGYLSSFICDAVMAYRLYIISDQKKSILYISIVVIPSALGLAVWAVINYALFDRVNQIPNIILAIGSISINFTCSSLIAWNIWSRNQLTMAVGGEKIIIRLLAIFVESSALYTGWMLIFLITHFTDNPLSQVFLYGLPHVAGIASMLINVRVGLGWAVGEECRSTYSIHNSMISQINDGRSRDSTSFDV